MSTRRFVAAAVQLCAGSDKVANLDKVEALAAEAARHDARLVVLPEVFLWRGPRADEVANAEPIPGPTTNRLAELARRLKIHLVAGSLLEQNGTDRAFNTSLLFDPHGTIVARYRKLHLFDIDIPEHVTIRESDTRAAGGDVVVAPTELGAIGMTICYDLRFPELYRRLTLAGAEIITVPSAFTFPTGAAHWEILLRARAIENQVYLIAPDQVGKSPSEAEPRAVGPARPLPVGSLDGAVAMGASGATCSQSQAPSGVVDFGNSMIVDPWGTPLARAADREMMILAEIDRDYQERVRRELPCLTHVKLVRA